MSDLISRAAAIDALSMMQGIVAENGVRKGISMAWQQIADLPPAQPEQEDYTELKREFLRMASYIDVLLECSDVQKETLIGFISRLAEFMPWTERD